MSRLEKSIAKSKEQEEEALIFKEEDEEGIEVVGEEVFWWLYIFLILRIDFIIIIKYDGFEDPQEDYTMVMSTEIVLPEMGRVAGFKIPRNGQELEVQTSKKGNKIVPALWWDRQVPEHQPQQTLQ